MTLITTLPLLLACVAVFLVERTGASFRAQLAKRQHRQDLQKIHAERYLEGYRYAVLNPNLSLELNRTTQPKTK